MLFREPAPGPDRAAAAGGDIDHAALAVGIIQDHHAAFEELTLVGKMIARMLGVRAS
jgi:hypothetical protein